MWHSTYLEHATYHKFNDKETINECTGAVNNLKNDQSPSVVPSPLLLGNNQPALLRYFEKQELRLALITVFKKV